MVTVLGCLRAGIDAFIGRFLLLFGAWLIILAAHQLIDRLIPTAWSWVGLLAFTVLLGPLYAGQYLLALKAVRGEPATLRDLFRGYSRFGTLIAVTFLVTLITAVGTCLLIVPGIYWRLTFVFAPVFVSASVWNCVFVVIFLYPFGFVNFFPQDFLLTFGTFVPLVFDFTLVPLSALYLKYRFRIYSFVLNSIQCAAG